MKTGKLKVAMVVVDGNDVSGASMQKGVRPSPAVHPAIAALLEGMALRDDVECRVLYGQSQYTQEQVRQEGALTYVGVPYKRLPMMGGAMAARYRALVKYVRCWSPDVVHGQGSERECALVAIRSDLPNIITLHGNFREISKVFHAQPFSYYWWAAKMETLALEQTNGLICISRYVEEITRPFPTKKFIIPNAIEKKYLNEGPRPYRASGKRRVCCMGTIDQRKQTRKILEACEKLWNNGMDFILDIYGSPGRGQSYFEEFTQALLPWVKKNMAHYHGFTTDPVEAIRCSDVMVSASCEESFGMNVLEAMALGVPVVAPEVGGIRDILIDGQTGSFYPPGDVMACAAKIEQLLLDENLQKTYSAQGIKRAREHFSPERIAEMTVQAYRQIAG